MFRRHQEKPWEENLQSNKELWQQKVNQNKNDKKKTYRAQKARHSKIDENMNF